jgi:hypothetical protein
LAALMLGDRGRERHDQVFEAVGIVKPDHRSVISAEESHR